MEIHQFIKGLYSRGFCLKSDGQCFWISPRARLTGADLAFIQEHRAEILATLENELAAEFVRYRLAEQRGIAKAA